MDWEFQSIFIYTDFCEIIRLANDLGDRVKICSSGTYMS